MSLIGQMKRNFKFVNQLYKDKAWVRSVLESPNCKFVHDFPPGHFYSPVPDLADIRERAKSIFDRSTVTLNSINLNEQKQCDLADEFSKLHEQMKFPDQKLAEYRYFFDNPYFSYGDGVILYSMLRHFQPKRVVEIGSGFSSAEMLDVNDRFLNKQVHFTFIEPYPERLLGLLSETDKMIATIEAMPVQRVKLDVFPILEENDILFVDSSHVAKTGSDVLHILFNIVPLLKKGVLVHFHDILWPFEYPEDWIEEGRAWNEAYFLKAFLQYNSKFEILFFNSYMALHHAGEMASKLPRMLTSPSLPETQGNTSLWLRRVG